jgi:cell division transport system ATP-binding protein
VIELQHGEMIRDERHGGYGDTSGIPSLAPEPERGAAAVAALTAVLEVQREAAAAIDPTLAPIDLAPESEDDELLAAEEIPDAVHGDPEPETPQAEPPAASHTQPIPVADIAEVDVAELGLADRLGLGETDPDDEVGPTS